MIRFPKVRAFALPIALLLPLALTSAEPACAKPGCCKVCHKGKACGDTCIPEERKCHTPGGCACDG